MTCSSRIRRAARSSSASTVALCAALLATPLLLQPDQARAEEDSAENKAAARDLAIEGIKLAQAGQCEEAVPKLTRAEKLYHAPTILTWIGQCQIQMGQYVEGTETLNSVIREKISTDSPAAYHDAQTKARELVQKAQPKIAKLTIEVAPPELEGLEVKVDDRAISAALVGAPRPTDPGTHVVTISAPGYKAASQEIKLEEGGKETITFTLERDPNAATGAVATTETAPADEAQSADSGGGIAPWIGWTTIGVGAALMAGGGVMGMMAINKEKELDCADSGACAPSEEETLKSARTNATVSTVLFGVGGAAVVTGVVLLITGKSSSESKTATTEPHISPFVGWASVGVSGHF